MFCVDIFIGSVSRMESPLCGYLEDIEVSWQQTWKTGSFFTSWMDLVDPKDHILKVLCWYLYYMCFKNGGPFMRVLGRHWVFRRGELEYRVILDIMDILGRPKGSYPESFVLISLLHMCQEWGVLHWCTRRTLMVPDSRLGEQGHYHVMDVLGRPQGSYPERV